MLSVFTDEISDDFDKACAIAADEFGLEWVQPRKLWGKNVMALDGREVAEARKILTKRGLRVSQIGSPLFKTDLAGAPVSPLSPKRDKFSLDYTAEQQPEVLERGIELCRVFATQRLRCFDFWRLPEPEPHRQAIYAKLREAANACAKHGLILSMEVEHECNTPTAVEAVRTVKGVAAPNFQLNWDPGNAFFAGETPFPDGWKLLDAKRISNVDCKDATVGDDGKPKWECIGRGKIDFVGQFRALKQAGYRGPITLETHWRGAGTAEESTRQSMAGLKAALKTAGLI
jgi:sugar phosphate isomerase/epimerase